MPSPYGGSSSRSGSPYGSGRGSRSSTRSSSKDWESPASWKDGKKKKKGASVGGLLGNLAGDVTDAVVGLGPAAYYSGKALASDASTALSLSGATGRSGKRSFKSDDVILKPIVDSYRYTYGPLARGDIGEFGHRVYSHPLGPLLDLATVASFGAAGLAKAGVAPAAIKRGTIQLRTPGGEIVEKPLPKQTLRAELQVGRAALFNKLPYETRVLGESARAARQVRKGPHKVARSRELIEVPFLKKLSKVRDKHERTAAFWLSQVPLPEDLANLTRQLEEVGTDQALKTVAILRDEKFLKNYMNPEPKLLQVLDEATQVAEAQRVILGIEPDAARQRAYMPILLARGARLEKIEGERAFIPPPAGMEEVSRPRTMDEAQARADDIEARLSDVVEVFIKSGPFDKDKVSKAADSPRRREAQRVARNRNVQKTAEMHSSTYRDAYGGPSYAQRTRIEAFQQMDDWVDGLLAKDPGNQTLLAYKKQLDELDYLKEAIRLNHPDAGIFEDLPEQIPSLGETTELKPAPGFASVEEMMAKIDADLEAAGRPKPVYMPHTSERPKAAHVYGTGGVGPQKSPGPMRQTMGILLSRGQVIADPQVLRNSFVKSIKWALYKDIHQLHLDHGRLHPAGDQIPEGWQVIRRTHSERTPYTVKTGAEFDEFAKQYLDKDAAFTFGDNPFTTNGPDAFELVEEGQKFRVIVPTEFSRQLAGEFVRAGSFARTMNAYPLRIWRHLVLKLRPAWLVNNILGNTMLYLVHSSDPVALQEFVGTFRRMVPKKQLSEFDDLLAKHFPEQIHGTFIGSQLPVFGSSPGSRLAKMERVTSYVGAGLAQVDRTFEAALRSSIVRAELRKSPELRKFAGKMRTQTDEFWKLADAELERNPLLAERISDRVGDALGDYLALGRIERDVIRSAFPFYAWYRVISLIVLRLPLTHPLKAQLLSRLGQAGAQTALEELGVPEENAISLAKSFVTLGMDEDGRARGVPTQSMNPLATIAQLQEFVIALAAGEPGEAWKTMPGLNPFIALPIEVTTGAKPRSGFQGSQRFGVFSAAPHRFWESLPEVRLGRAILNKSYQGTPESPTLYDRGRRDELLRYTGIPYARVSPERIEEIGTGNATK